MAKLRDLITEREFGEPLPTFKDVMEKHQVNKLKENWWDDLSDEAQAAYIKKHGEAPNVAGGDDEGGGDEGDYDMGAVPGSRELDDTPEDVDDDDYDSEKGSSLTSAPGRVPDEDNSERLEQIAQEKASLEQEMEDAEARGDKAAYADADEKLYELEQEEEKLGGGESGGEDDLGDPYPDGNAPPDTSMIDDFSSQKWLDWGLEQQRQYQTHLEKWAEEAADNDDDEALAKIEELMAENKKEQERLEKDGAKSMYRTGNELNQETLTIDGKQYRRISEGVEKQPKPKYEFSEFYQRFKK